MKKIGIMGGTFDPIHAGHLMLGKQAYEEYRLDSVWYMPSRQPPHKKDHAVSPAPYRLEMVRLATADVPFFFCSDFELRRQGGNTYTSETLTLLKKEYPDTEFYFIVGADSVFDLEKWHCPEIVMASAVILAADRPSCETEGSLEAQIRRLACKYHARIERLHSGLMDVSSKELREMIRKGEPVSPYLPPAVEEFIRRNGLYGI